MRNKEFNKICQKIEQNELIELDLTKKIYKATISQIIGVFESLKKSNSITNIDLSCN